MSSRSKHKTRSYSLLSAETYKHEDRAGQDHRGQDSFNPGRHRRYSLNDRASPSRIKKIHNFPKRSKEFNRIVNLDNFFTISASILHPKTINKNINPSDEDQIYSYLKQKQVALKRSLEWLGSLGGYPIFDEFNRNSSSVCHSAFVRLLYTMFILACCIFGATTILLNHQFCSALTWGIDIFHIQTLVLFIMSKYLVRKLDTNNTQHYEPEAYANDSIANKSNSNALELTLVPASDDTNQQESPKSPELTSNKILESSAGNCKEIMKNHGLKMIVHIETSEYIIARMRFELGLASIMLILPWVAGILTIFAQILHIDDYISEPAPTKSPESDYYDHRTVVILETIRKILDIFRYLSVTMIIMLFRIQFHSFRIRFLSKILIKHGLFHMNNAKMRRIVQSSFVWRKHLCSDLCATVTCATKTKYETTMARKLRKFHMKRAIQQIEPYCTHVLPDDLNSSQFIIDINNLLDPYATYVRLFKCWIVWFLVFNFATYTLIGISSLYYFFSEDRSCDYLLIYYFHDWMQFTYFLVSWILVIEPISNIHNMLQKFTSYFEVNTVFKQNSPDLEKKLVHKKQILEYLNKITSSDNSPFQIAWFIPTSKNLCKLLVIVFITMAFELMTSLGIIQLNFASMIKSLISLT